MVRVISQETFDAVVAENMEEFDMDRETAVKEAKEQFESQGVSLANIVFIVEEDHAVLTALKALKVSDPVPSNEEVQGHCATVKTECSKGLAEKVLATKNEGYETLIKVAEDSKDDEIKSAAISALAALLFNNPDPFDPKGFSVVVSGLKKDQPPELIGACLEMALSSCVRHEQNRQNLVKYNFLTNLDDVFDIKPVGVARVWQALVQDDDVRVPYGKAHDHAREIVEEHSALSKLVSIMKSKDPKDGDNKDLSVLLSCTSSLAVRNEYCQAIVDEGGLQVLLDLLLDPDQPVQIVMESLRLVKALAGNDNVKKDIRSTKGVGIIVNSMSKHIANKAVCQMGCGAISAVCLRTPENAQMVMEANGAQLLTQILKTHVESPKVLTACAGAIRNIVSRSKNYTKDFVELDVETLLNEAMVKHPKTEDTIKSALRDLGLKVVLKEQWKGGLVSNNSKLAEEN